MKRPSPFLFPLLCLALLWAAVPAQAAPVLVVAKNSPIDTLAVEQAADVFLGRLTSLPNGVPLQPIDQSDGSAVRAAFHSKVTRKSGPLLKAYWSKILFTGRGQPPREAPDDAGVKKIVIENPNAVGYIDEASVDANVKVVLSVSGS